MVNFCAVIGCAKRGDRDKHLSYYRLPKIRVSQGEQTRLLSEERQGAWLAKIGRPNIKVSNYPYTRVCSLHFVTGKPATLYDMTNLDWAPTINLGHDNLTLPGDVASSSRKGRKSKRAANKTRLDMANTLLAMQSSSDPINHVEPPAGGSSRNSKKCQTDLSIDALREMQEEMGNLTLENSNLKVELASAKLAESSLAGDDGKTHPSVRIRGTENNYEPVQCIAPQCANKVPHMHCPFCTKAESFVDPVILKAHYRVKHVDKGIEFAGLKVLRCCDHCDIVGTIKGVKEFKGAHWHCYKCKNGFNRRDEAIKHYRTHFRNPQTTFQIQITQEINQMYPLGHEVETAAESLAQQDLTTIHPALTEAVMTTTATELLTSQQEPGLTNGRAPDGEVHVAVAANETVDASEGQTIMIIHEDTNQLDSSEEHVQQDRCTFQITNSSGAVQLHSVDQAKLQQHQQHVQVQEAVQEAEADIDQSLFDLQQRNEQLEMEKAHLEQEVDQLKLQVQMAGQDLSAYQKREQDLLAQLSIPLDERIHELLRQLKADHEDLLHQQLAHLRKSYLGHQLDPEVSEDNIIIVTPDVATTEPDTETAIRLVDGVGSGDAGGYVSSMVDTTDVDDVDMSTSDNHGDVIERTTADICVSADDPQPELKSGVVTSNSSGLVGNNVTITLSSEQFKELEETEVEEQHAHIVISDEMVQEPPQKRKKVT